MTTTALPDWVAPATAPTNYTSVGIKVDGDLYLYGEKASDPGPTVPAVRGYLLDITIAQRGSGSRFGSRNYLELTLAGTIPTETFILRLPCKPSLNSASGSMQLPWAVRSLLGALCELSLGELDDQAIKLQTRRGDAAVFFQVFPYDSAGNELPEVRAESIGPSESDLLAAVNQIRSTLGRQPLAALPTTHPVHA
jgi:hypothetical protein